MATMDDVFAFVAAHPRTYGNALHGRSDLWVVIEDLPGKTAAEKLYNYKHPEAWDLSRKCRICDVGPMPFRAGKYKLFCSNKCSANDPALIAKVKVATQTPTAKAKRAATRKARDFMRERPSYNIYDLAGLPRPKA